MSYREDLVELLVKQLGVDRSDIFNDVILSRSGAINLFGGVYFQFIAWNNPSAWITKSLDLDDENKYKQNPAQWITEKMEEAIKNCEFDSDRKALIVKYLMWKNVVQNSKAANDVVFKLNLSEEEIEEALVEYVREEVMAELWDRVREESLYEMPEGLTPDDEEFYDVLDEIEERLFEEFYEDDRCDICEDVIKEIIKYLPEYEAKLYEICEDTFDCF